MTEEQIIAAVSIPWVRNTLGVAMLPIWLLAGIIAGTPKLAWAPIEWFIERKDGAWK